MKLLTWSKRLLALLLALLGLALGLALLYAWRASPQHGGELQAPGLSAPVQIDRDADGIPHLRAESPADLAYALGFSHAQDRGWQLEVQRRIGAGRMAEAFGPAALDTDRFLRAVGVHRNAQAQWAWMKAQAQHPTVPILEAYAAGVNAGWRSQARPPEMLVLGLQFEDWTPADSLAWATMMAWDLAGNWQQEMLRLRLALRWATPAKAPAGESALARIQALIPPYPGDPVPDLEDFPALYASLGLGPSADAPLERLQAAAPRSGVEGVGSNNWAVDGTHSVTGHPLLANDPHLKLQAPALWYLARLQAPDQRVAGATLPGLPSVVLGQNEHLAWGFTNTGPDTQDLYLEEWREVDGRAEVRTPEGWQALSVREERITVKGAAAETLRVRSGPHGPFISDAGTGADLLPARGGRRFALALRWTALESGHDPIGAGLQLNQARSWADYRRAVTAWNSPMQNMLVAERGGGIHYIAPGKVPVRASGHGLRGMAPAPGWERRYDWLGYLPFAALPQESQPSRGWLATANQKIVGPDYPHFLGSDWALPWRQQRIEAHLQATARHSLDSFAALQADVQSEALRELLPVLRDTRSQHPLASQALATLQGFDGQSRADSPAAAVANAWVYHLTRALLEDELGTSLFDRVLATRSFRDTLHEAFTGRQTRWCDRVDTPEVEACAALSTAALDQALNELEARLGKDPTRWRWGDLHRAKAEHRPFSRVPLLRPYFELSLPIGGDTYTVNVARVNLRPDWAGERYTNDHGPSLRALYDVADPRQSRAMISTGQSGLPWSRHYRDLLPRWAAVDYLPLWEAPATEQLRLAPADTPARAHSPK